MSEREALTEYLAVGIEGAFNRYPLINLERGEYDAIAATAARACLDAGFVPTASAERVAELQAERDALAATVQRVRALCDEARFYVDSHDEGGPDLPPTARLRACGRPPRRPRPVRPGDRHRR